MPPPPVRHSSAAASNYNGQPLFRPLPPQPQPQLAVGVDGAAGEDGRGAVPEFVSIGGGPAGTNTVHGNIFTQWGVTEASASAGKGNRKKVKARRPNRPQHPKVRMFKTATKRNERNKVTQSSEFKKYQDAGGPLKDIGFWKCTHDHLLPSISEKVAIWRLERGWTVEEILTGVAAFPTGRPTMDNDEAKDVYEKEIKPFFTITKASDPPMSENPLPPTNQAASAGLPRSRTNTEETCASYAGAARSRTSTQDSVITFGSAAPATPRSTYLHSPAISNYDLSPAVSAALSATSKASARKRQRNREATECDDHMLRRIRKRNEDQAKVENEFEKMAFKARLKRDAEEDDFNKEGLGVINDALKFQLNLSGEEEFA